MSNAKEKADELIDEFKDLTMVWSDSEHEWIYNTPDATKCAVICVEEILNGSKVLGTKAISRRKFWHEVLSHLKGEKL